MRVFEILSKTGKVVSLAEVRWRHVLEHPEMQNQLDKVKETVENPDEVRESSRMSSTWLFYKFYIKSPVTKKYLLVVVKVLNGEGFIVTAFFTNKVKKGGLIWKKKD